MCEAISILPNWADPEKYAPMVNPADGSLLPALAPVTVLAPALRKSPVEFVNWTTKRHHVLTAAPLLLFTFEPQYIDSAGVATCILNTPAAVPLVFPQKPLPLVHVRVRATI